MAREVQGRATAQRIDRPGHTHSHLAEGSALRTALLLTIVVLIIEVVVGYRANSLALVSDAGHILTDVFALGLAWFASRLSARPGDERNTFGYRRSGILAALINAAVLLLITVFIALEAVMRIRHPQHVSGGLVIGGALLAIGVNAYIAWRLHAAEQGNLNIRAALLHVVGDIGASIGVATSGSLVVLWSVYWADPALSLLIAVLIAYGSWQLVRDTVTILMEGTPRGVDLDRLRAAMLEVPGVEEVHDLHVWSLSDGYRLLSAHVSVPEQSLADAADLLADLKLLLRRRFHIEHATIEPECIDCRAPRPRRIQFEDGRRAPKQSDAS